MGFPSHSGVRQQDLAVAWNTARAIAGAIKEGANTLRTASAAGPVTGRSIIKFSAELADHQTQLSLLAQVPGLGAYAQQQISDETFDIGATYAAMSAQITATISWITTNMPKDGSGYLLIESFDGQTGKTVGRTFSTAQTTTLRTVLEALVATID